MRVRLLAARADDDICPSRCQLHTGNRGDGRSQLFETKPEERPNIQTNCYKPKGARVPGMKATVDIQGEPKFLERHATSLPALE